MTCRERLAVDCPEYIGDCWDGGCRGCPETYGYLPRPIWCGEECNNSVERYNICAKCWDREIPEEKSDIQKAWEKIQACGTSDACVPNGVREVVEMPTIKDSGNRREFETGAVRDIQEGKGRCDLMPLDVVVEYLDQATNAGYNVILKRIYRFIDTGELNNLHDAIAIFTEQHWDDNLTMLLEVSKHFEEGAKKYGENNWQKGIPTHCYIDSAVRHYLKYLRGDKDEPHDRAFVWNVLCCIWTCKHKPELNDYAVRDSE